MTDGEGRRGGRAVHGELLVCEQLGSGQASCWVALGRLSSWKGIFHGEKGLGWCFLLLLVGFRGMLCAQGWKSGCWLRCCSCRAGCVSPNAHQSSCSLGSRYRVLVFGGRNEQMGKARSRAGCGGRGVGMSCQIRRVKISSCKCAREKVEKEGGRDRWREGGRERGGGREARGGSSAERY